MEGLPPFHLAIRVRDLDEARKFYGELLGCRKAAAQPNGWISIFSATNWFATLPTTILSFPREESNVVDGHDVPVPHFGAVLEIPNFESLSRKLEASGVRFVVEPHVRFKGQPGEQATMFLLDPSGNAIEFKAFRNIREQLFAK